MVPTSAKALPDSYEIPQNRIDMKKILLTLPLLLLALTAGAKVKPAPLISDGMVLQQQSDCKLWGFAKPNSRVTARGSWGGKTVQTRSDAQGRWQLRLPTPKGSFTPYELTLSDGDKLVIKDVLIGEVWLGGGQSNMEMSLQGRNNRVIDHVNQEIIGSLKYSGKLRLATVSHNLQLTPADSVAAPWKDCSPATVTPWSAVCYFFGSTLVDALQVPVGMIASCWGGTTVESWTPAEICRSYTDLKQDKASLSKGKTNTPIVRYNGMIHPIAGYTLKGFIWYQGEANVGHHNQYADRLSNLISAWRQRWGQGDLPFYEVEICPYHYGDVSGDKAALLREAQWDVTRRLPHVGCVSTNDLVRPYEVHQIHPSMKRPVGERLAMMALSRDYRMQGFDPECPQYESMEVKDSKVYLKVSHSKSGFSRFDDLEGFEVCGPDGVYYPAQASIEGVRLVVSSPKVLQPRAVKYCFHNWSPGTVANTSGLPLVPFRSQR